MMQETNQIPQVNATAAVAKDANGSTDQEVLCKCFSNKSLLTRNHIELYFNIGWIWLAIELSLSWSFNAHLIWYSLHCVSYEFVEIKESLDDNKTQSLVLAPPEI